MITLMSLLFLSTLENTLHNPTFEKGLESWGMSQDPQLMIEAIQESGRPAVRMVVPESVKPSWPMIFQDFPAKPEQVVKVSADILSRNINDGAGAYFAVEYHDESGKRLGFEQSSMATRDGKWNNLATLGIAPPGTSTCRIALIVNGHGEGVFSNVQVAMTNSPSSKPLDGPVTLTVTKDVVCDSLIGFGAEDDGWFYNQENAAKGVTKEDWAIREGRIDWMHPDWIRMFFWYKDFNPSGDWETFDFDSDNMRSHYRTLDQYQRLGAKVNVVGVEWGVNKPFHDPAKLARAVGALMEHLIRNLGYTCVSEWTLTNEPNGFYVGSGYSFENFREIHRLVKEEFVRRKLNVRIVGSDDTGGYSFFEQCVNDDAYYGLSDYFASHRYIQHASRPLMSLFLDERLELLAKKTPKKQLIVAEFGFQDQRSGALENPIMKEYPYAIWTSSFVIEGLNKGVAGYSIWCLHETYYPGNGFMTYGTWNYKEDNWKPRPVYHTWAAFSRFTKAGDKVFQCYSTHPGHVSGSYVGETLFWVNQSDKAADVILAGISPKTVCVMKEDTLHGDRECGETTNLKENRFTAPPMSFGYAR